MNILDILTIANKKLKENNIEDPIKKARILLAHLLNVKKEYLIIHEGEELGEALSREYLDKINEICNNRPFQYVIGTQEFMGNKFKVNENVLIPRADTEILVEEVLKLIKTNDKVLELCVGSGAISVSIAKVIKNIELIAIDISNKAIEVAKENAKINKVDNIVSFMKSDMFQNVEGVYDIIVANPPYIETEVIETLENEVKNEPVIALDGGRDGLDFYRKISNESMKHLKNGGYICLEIGYNQKEAVTEIFSKYYTEIKCVKDLGDNDRVIICKWEG